MGEPKFLTLTEVYFLHDESLARFGGSAGVRDPGLVASALASAENTYWYGHGTVFEIASAYAFHLAESQAFLDGNKRTATAAAIMFLRINGFSFLRDDGTLYKAVIDIASKKLDKPGLAKVLHQLSRS